MTEHTPDLLIGDAERRTAAEHLRDHYEAGRLTVGELEGRLERVQAARTESDLRTALHQLPSAKLPSLRLRDHRWRSLATQYATLNGVAILVWLFTDHRSDFWPKWVLLATLIMFARRAAGRSRR